MIVEQILNKHLYNKFDNVDRATFIAAMEEYGKLEFERGVLSKELYVRGRKYEKE